MKTLFFVLFLITSVISVYGQEHFMGMLDNDEEYEAVPLKAQLLTRDYTSLPLSYSLKKYCPTPKDQGSYGTCTSWATAYAARTIAEAIKNNWTNKLIIDMETFSPPFIYKQIKDADDKNCKKGSCISDALDLMMYKGVPKYSSFSPMCADYIPVNLFTSASDYKIDNYFKLFSIDDSYETKIRAVKKALAENCPVIGGIKCYASFSSAKDCWNGLQDHLEGGHAICIIGYDDTKYGGAFQIMNSWGTDWGNAGFTWIKYSDFAQNMKYAFELYLGKKETPAPQPTPTPAVVGKPSITWSSALTSNSSSYTVKAVIKSTVTITSVSLKVNGSAVACSKTTSYNGKEASVVQSVTLKEGTNTIVLEAANSSGTIRSEQKVNYVITKDNKLSGSFYVQLATGEKMPVALSSGTSIPTYKANGSYISGTRYRIYISNNEPAYVYVIASDLNNSVSKVFPPADNISPALVYKSNNIALPDEQWYLQMDNTVGTDYLCLIYSMSALDINDVIKQLKNSTGTFYNRLQNVLGKKIAPKGDITLSSSTIDFKAQTAASIVPIVLEITHK